MNIYFSGIGGVGIGPLAEIALDAGHTVQGSDQQESPLTWRLLQRGVAVSFNQDGAFLEACHQDNPIDWFVHTAALPDAHPELVAARQLGIRVAKRDELLAQIIKEKDLQLIAVTGTHGKTTTTGMMIWAFQQLGIAVSYSIGTTLSFGPSGCYVEGSRYFIYECDEFDRNFLHFRPALSLITSLDYDHPDTYPTPADYTAAFQQFAAQSQHIIMWHHDNTDLKIAGDHAWLLQDSEISTVALPGAHNRRNATLVVKAIEYLELGGNIACIAALERFPGTHRRFEKLGDNLYSDYGHHPVEISATLQLAHELSHHVVLVYQPHQNIRQHELRTNYTHCFEQAEKVYWLPTYLSREDPSLPILTPQELAQHVSNPDTIHFADLAPALWHQIEAERANGRLVLLMGAGDIDPWARQQLQV